MRQGSQRDAVLYSVGANTSHGLRRTNEDKRRAVRVLLEDAEWSQWSNREIAKRAGVSADLVDRLRAHLPDSGRCEGPRKVERNGATYKMQTARINADRPKPSQLAPQERARLSDSALGQTGLRRGIGREGRNQSVNLSF